MGPRRARCPRPASILRLSRCTRMTGGGYGANELARRIAGRSRFASALVRLAYPPMPTLNVMPLSVVREVQQALFRPGALVINIGSGALSGCGRRLWKNADTDHCTVFNLDIQPDTQVELVGDAHALPFADGSSDSVVLQAVLEHVVEPRGVIAEAERVLKPGGHLYIEMPFLQGFHADPHDYQRYTLEGLRHRLEKFEEIASGVSVGPFCALVWIIRDGASSSFRNPFLYATIRFAFGWLLGPLRYLDYLVRGNRAAVRLASEYYFLCRRRGHAK